jgi:hypothetical protein
LYESALFKDSILMNILLTHHGDQRTQKKICTASGDSWAMIKAKGEKFVKKVKEQQIKLYSLDAPALVNVIAAGEVVASPAIFQSHTWLAATKGTPVEGCRWNSCPITWAARPSPLNRQIRMAPS